MTFSEYWNNLRVQNPQLTEENTIKLDVPEFRHQLELAYNEGLKDGTVKSQVSVYEQIYGKPKEVSRPVSIVESIFGVWK